VPDVKAGLLLVKNISLIGLQVSDYRDRAPETMRRTQEHLFDLYKSGKLKPHVMGIYPLEAWREALSVVAQRRALGKVVLHVRSW
jgi:NADPH2:quinone reductase